MVTVFPVIERPNKAVMGCEVPERCYFPYCGCSRGCISDDFPVTMTQPDKETIYCSNCGAPNPKGATYCLGCGKILNP